MVVQGVGGYSLSEAEWVGMRFRDNSDNEITWSDRPLGGVASPRSVPNILQAARISANQAFLSENSHNSTYAFSNSSSRCHLCSISYWLQIRRHGVDYINF